jgi:hypothetical protein
LQSGRRSRIKRSYAIRRAGQQRFGHFLPVLTSALRSADRERGGNMEVLLAAQRKRSNIVEIRHDGHA